MKPKSFMLIAGEPSGDWLGAELVAELRAKVLEVESEPTEDVQPRRTPLMPEFFGAGGPQMAAAGVRLAFDLTQHSVIGPSDVLKNLFKFRRLFRDLFRLAVERKPDVIIGVDYGAFNLRFARAIRRHTQRQLGWFAPWNPKLVQYVSPQVWASRPGRAYQLARDYDLLLSIFPFEKEWYAARVPRLRVEFVGHPIIDRYASLTPRASPCNPQSPLLLLLPGSRLHELRRHFPVMLEALKRIRAAAPGTRARMILPLEELVRQAQSFSIRAEFPPPDLELHAFGLPESLAQADLAIASTGTVTMECAYFGVATVTLYKTSWSTYQIARRIVTVKWLTMPNLLAGEEIFPEFVQHRATPENLARAALELLRDEVRRQEVKAKLAKVIASLGGPGPNARAAEAIVRLLP